MIDIPHLAVVLGGAGMFLLYAFLRIFWPGRDARQSPAQDKETGISTEFSFGGFMTDLGGGSGGCGGAGGDGGGD